MIHVGTVELAWLGITFLALAICTGLLVDAVRDYRAVKALNGRAREVAVSGSVRGEAFRIVILACLFVVAVPGIFSDREVMLSLPIALLMAVPSLLLLWAYTDKRERRYLTALVARETRQ